MTEHGAWATVLLLASLFSAGCTFQATNEPAAASLTASQREPIVVAVIDSGINPYHASFAGSLTTKTGVVSTPIMLSDDKDLQRATEADRETWNHLQKGTLYSFGGTRVLAISFLDDSNAPRILDRSGHGTATASIVAREAPDAIIVLLQVESNFCDRADCLISPTIASALEWAAQQPWIDVVSMSLSIPANPPDSPAAHAEMARFLAAERKLHDSGVLIVAASGNYATPTYLDYFNGPPWVISVGGFEPAQRGDTVISSKGVDVTANFTETVARGDDRTGFKQDSGTSFATPVVAGTIASTKAVLRGVGLPRVQERALIRSALNATALEARATDWNPQPERTLSNPLAASIPMLAPSVQQGWGYVSGPAAQHMAAIILKQEKPPPHDAETVQLQAAFQSVRESYWNS